MQLLQCTFQRVFLFRILDPADKSVWSVKSRHVVNASSYELVLRQKRVASFFERQFLNRGFSSYFNPVVVVFISPKLKPYLPKRGSSSDFISMKSRPFREVTSNGVSFVVSPPAPIASPSMTFLSECDHLIGPIPQKCP